VAVVGSIVDAEEGSGVVLVLPGVMLGRRVGGGETGMWNDCMVLSTEARLKYS